MFAKLIVVECLSYLNRKIHNEIQYSTPDGVEPRLVEPNML